MKVETSDKVLEVYKSLGTLSKQYHCKDPASDFSLGSQFFVDTFTDPQVPRSPTYRIDSTNLVGD